MPILLAYPTVVAAGGTAPVINDVTFNIDDGYDDDQTVGTITPANSPSPAASYSITGGNTGTTFAINSSTGVITVIEPTNLVADADYSLTITATNSAGSDTCTATVNVAEEGADTLLAGFTLTNYDSGASSSTARLTGHVFKQGDVPTGNKVLLKSSGSPVSHSVVNRSYYPNGDLMSCHFVYRGSSVSASGDIDLDIYTSTGTHDDTDPGVTFIEVLAALPAGLRVDLSSWTGDNAGGSGSGRAVPADGDVSARLNWTVISPYVVCVNTWSMVKDGATGAGSTNDQLKVGWYYRCHLDASGNIEHVFCKPVIQQDWYTVGPKSKQSYTAAFKSNSTTYATYSSLVHYYNCWWAGVDPSDSLDAGKPFCVTGTDCKLVPTYDKEYWNACECFPSLDPAFTPNELSVTKTYTALNHLAHRPGIDSGGAYGGRGFGFTQYDIHAFMLQTPNAWRVARVNAYCGHHVFYHHRQGDKSMSAPDTCMTLRFRRAGVDGDDDLWVADGMPTAIFGCVDGVSTVPRGNPPDTGYVVPDEVVANGNSGTGGDDGGFFPTTNDASHAVNWSTFMWLVDGEEDFRQAMLDCMNYLAMQVPWDAFTNMKLGGGVNSTGFYNTQYQAAFSFPDDSWAPVAQVIYGQERTPGFALSIITGAAGFCPEGAIEKNYCDAFLDFQADFLEETIALLTGASGTAMKNVGLWKWSGADENVNAVWMNSIVSMNVAWADLVTGRQGFSDLADMVGNFTYNVLATNPQKAAMTRSVTQYKSANWNASTNPFVAPTDILFPKSCTVVGSTDLWTVSRTAGGTDRLLLTLADGDEAYALRWADITGQSPGDTSVTSPLTEGTKYFLRDVTVGSTTITFKLSLTHPSGTVVNIGADDTQILGFNFKSGIVTPILDGGSDSWGEDDYIGMASCAAAMQLKREHALMTEAIFNQTDAFMGGVDFAPDARWKAALPA